MSLAKKLVAGITTFLVLTQFSLTARKVSAAVDREAFEKAPQEQSVVEIGSKAQALVNAIDGVIELLQEESLSAKEQAELMNRMNVVQSMISAGVKEAASMRKELAGLMVADGVCNTTKEALAKIDETKGLPSREQGEYLGDKFDAVKVSVENWLRTDLPDWIRGQSQKNAISWIDDVKNGVMWFFFKKYKMEQVLEMAKDPKARSEFPILMPKNTIITPKVQ